MSFKMTDRLNIPNVSSETLFAFDLLVEYIRINKDMKVSDELALGVRLLDFPTLLIYQPQQQAGGHVMPQTLQENDNREREKHLCPRPRGDKHDFNKGKSCLFKINLDSLHKHLSNTPLYAMVLDVKDEVPKLVGSSQISLANPMDRIKSDVNARGISTPSCQAEKRLIDIFNLMGEKIGLMSLGYKLLSLGASLLPHISENKACGEENTSATETQPNESGQARSLNLHKKLGLCENIQQNGQSKEKVVVHEAKQEVVISAATQTEHGPRSKQQQQKLQLNDLNFEEDVTVFCPPHLFYHGTAGKTSKNKSDDYKLLKLDLESFIVEDASSEDDAPESEHEGPGSPVIDQRTRWCAKQSNGREPQETTGLAPNALGDTLRQLPLLNALLVELSQLHGQTQQQPLPIHQNLAWIYRPGPGLGNTLTDVQTTAQLHKTTRQSTSPGLEGIPHPQRCSTPRGRSAIGRQVKNVQREDVCLISKPPNPSPRKKLVYGTTKTFRLRLKRITPGVARRRECMELTETQTHKTKGKISNDSNKKVSKKHTGRKKMSNGSSSFDEETIETTISSIAVDTSPQETTTPLKKRDEDGHKPQRSSEAETLCCVLRDNSPKPSEKPLHSKEEKKPSIHVPNVVDQDARAQNSDDNNHVRLESKETQTEANGNRERVETPGNSRFNSPKSSYSTCFSSRGKEEVEYPDDFTSVEPSDGYSPDPIYVVYSPEPLSSPEPASAKTKAKKTRKSPVFGDFYTADIASERVQRWSAALPVPIKADSSPQHSLKGTHIIRPRTQASALSVSSDNDEGDGSASFHTVRSINQMTSSYRTKRSSVTESLRSSRSQQSDSTRNSVPVREFSVQSVSSFDPQETEELEDDLGSLGFTNRYRHVSELVANKLPGYTL